MSVRLILEGGKSWNCHQKMQPLASINSWANNGCSFSLCQLCVWTADCHLPLLATAVWPCQNARTPSFLSSFHVVCTPPEWHTGGSTVQHRNQMWNALEGCFCLFLISACSALISSSLPYSQFLICRGYKALLYIALWLCSLLRVSSVKDKNLIHALQTTSVLSQQQSPFKYLLCLINNISTVCGNN